MLPRVTAPVERMRRRWVFAALALVPALAVVFGVVALATGHGGKAAGARPSILNPHPAAGPFNVDDTTVQDCEANRGDRSGPLCFEQAFGNVAYRTSAKHALTLAVMDGRSVPAISADCHRIAHAIGAAVLARENGNVAVALAEGDSTCWSGFYHGLLERALAPARSADELAKLIRTLCEPGERTWSRFTLYQCLHGLGHGLMLRTGYAMQMSLDMCWKLGDDWSRQSCTGGVFMESFSPSLGGKPPPFDPQDPLAPCPELAERTKLYCYLQVADNLVRATGYRWEKVAAACRTEPSPTWRARCFEGYGRQASGSNYGQLATVATLCRIAGDGESDCVYGASRDIASNASSGGPAASFCRVVARSLQARCFEGVGTIVSTLETGTQSVRARCAALARTYLADCLRGAGLPA